MELIGTGFLSGCSSSSEALAGSYLRAQKATITKKIQKMKITEMPWGGGSLHISVPFLFRWKVMVPLSLWDTVRSLGPADSSKGSRQIQAINGALAMERHCWTGSLKKVRESSTTQPPCQFGSPSGRRFSCYTHGKHVPRTHTPKPQRSKGPSAYIR